MASSADLQPDERDPQIELLMEDDDYSRAMWHATQQTCYCHHHYYTDNKYVNNIIVINTTTMIL